MKTKHILLPLISLAALYLSACQKELNPDDIISRVDSLHTLVTSYKHKNPS